MFCRPGLRGCPLRGPRAHHGESRRASRKCVASRAWRHLGGAAETISRARGGHRDCGPRLVEACICASAGVRGLAPLTWPHLSDTSSLRAERLWPLQRQCGHGEPLGRLRVASSAGASSRSPQAAASDRVLARTLQARQLSRARLLRGPGAAFDGGTSETKDVFAVRATRAGAGGGSDTSQLRPARQSMLRL